MTVEVTVAGARKVVEALRASMSAYEVCIASGHTPLKAAQSVLDAQRGDDFSKAWIECLRRGLSIKLTAG